LEKYLKLEAPLKVVFDCSNGTTGMVLEEIARRNDLLDMHLINDEQDGTFPAHNPSPLVEGAMDDLIKATPTQEADIGIIFDPDGDRVFFVDEKGKRIDPREMFFLLAPSFDPPYTINVSMGKKTLEWIMPDFDSSDVIETKTGHYFIKQLMRDKDVSFGIEHSGHFYFKDFFSADSGILPALIVMSEVSKMKKEGNTLSKWRESTQQIYQTSELNFEIKDKSAAVEKVKEYFAGETLKELDGITVEGESFWLNVRPSNTEPSLRVNLAAKSEDVLEEKKKEILELLQE